MRNKKNIIRAIKVLFRTVKIPYRSIEYRRRDDGEEFIDVCWGDGHRNTVCITNGDNISTLQTLMQYAR